MPVPTLITQLDTAAANNSPPGTESARGNIDDYLRAHASFIRQVFNGAQSGSYAWAGTAGGTANALTLTLTPAITAYSAGQRFVFKSGASANSGVTTAAVSGLTPLAVQVNGAACAGGEIAANSWYEALVDASLTSCQLMKIGRLTLTETGAAASGANSDILSLSGLTTALSKAQGGTGNTTGSIPLGQLSAAAANSGYPQSGTGGETLRTLRGDVAGNGGINHGSGFSVARNSAGNYTITFSSFFSATPTAIVTINDNTARSTINYCTTTTTNIATVNIFLGTVATDQAFNFIVIGPA